MYPKKHLGQHFLHEPKVIAKIVASFAPKRGEHVVEIGPGLGALTTKLLPLLHEIDVVEYDSDVIPKLEMNCKNLGILHVHQSDVLKFDFGRLGSPLRIIGNLPYNISSPILFLMVKNFAIIKDMHFMLQKEVAERIVASPGSKIYGRLSVMLQYYFDCQILLSVKSGAFTPPPKVDSAFIRLKPRGKCDLDVKDEQKFSDVVRLAFGQRRKTIANSLKSIISGAQLQQIGIDSQLRPEQLTVRDFIMITNL